METALSRDPNHSSVEAKVNRLKESIERRKDDALKIAIARKLETAFGKVRTEPIARSVDAKNALQSDSELFNALRARLGRVIVKHAGTEPARDPLAFIDRYDEHARRICEYDLRSVLATYLGVKPVCCGELTTSDPLQAKEILRLLRAFHEHNPDFGYRQKIHEGTRRGTVLAYDVWNGNPVFDVRQCLAHQNRPSSGPLLRLLDGAEERRDYAAVGILLGFGEENSLAYAEKIADRSDKSAARLELERLKNPPEILDAILFAPPMNVIRPRDKQLIAIGESCKLLFIALDPHIALHAGLDGRDKVLTIPYLYRGLQGIGPALESKELLSLAKEVGLEVGGKNGPAVDYRMLDDLTDMRDSKVPVPGIKQGRRQVRLGSS